jgi:DNA recombination protein RmuC
MIAIFAVVILLAAGLWFLAEQKKRMEETFKAMSYDVLEKNGRQFMQMADTALQPIRESMKALDGHQREIEKKREGAYSALTQQLDGLVASERMLRSETSKLSQALKSSQTRGSWGEVHLKRVVELSGLLNQCDFFEQKTLGNLRPDLVVRLPGGKCIAVDAKTPLSAYLEAAGSSDEAFVQRKMQEHGAAVRKHIRDLASKQYWKQFEQSPEYVILFLPSEAFFSAALQADPTLIEIGADQNIVIATPTTLIAILRAVAFSFKQEALSKNAEEMARLGAELYERVGIFCEHWTKVGKALNGAVDCYNQSVASLEARMLVSARKLKETGSFAKELPEPEGVEKHAKIEEKSLIL